MTSTPASREKHSLVRLTSIRPRLRAFVSFALGVVVVTFGYTAGRQEALVLAGVAFLLPLCGVIYVRIRRPKISVTRLFSPPVVAAGSRVRMTIRLRNEGTVSTIPFAGDDAIPWQESLASHEVPGLGTTAATNRTRVVEDDVHPPRRGLYVVGPFVVEYEDPFGMWRASVAVGETDRLVVVPRLAALGDDGPALADGDGSAQLVRHRVTGNDDDLTTREYRVGDALRRVHWRASARRGELMVRQEEHRSHPDARVLVDTRRSGYPDASRDRSVWWSDWSSESFEWVVAMSASLGIHLDGAGFRLEVEESSRGQIEQFGPRTESRRGDGFLTSLAGVQLSDEDDLDQIRLGDAVGPLFAVAADPDDATIDWMIHRRAPNAPAYAFLVEPRQAVVVRLRNEGWTVVEVDPDSEPMDAWRGSASATRAVTPVSRG
ncbi:MAG: DUF58 domain-containing protein [Pseudolysinimonas sp.]|uniref:DUF58 domain-containing protein n=1 Tax=Pseudolysinimonas sp. TaxID=2680009 RepID=UPI0032665C7B